MQVRFRLPQFEQGCWPEHLIFCRRHREQAFDERFVTFRWSFEVAIPVVCRVRVAEGMGNVEKVSYSQSRPPPNV